MSVTDKKAERRRWVKDHPNQAAALFAVAWAAVLIPGAKIIQQISWTTDLGVVMPFAIAFGVFLARVIVHRESAGQP